jgi:hypothetical protein
MRRIIGAVALAVVLGGCQTSATKVSGLTPGSRPDRVIAALGQPSDDTIIGPYEIYTYRQRRSLRSLHRVDYTVVFKEGQLVAFGPGAAKHNGADDMVIVPPALGIL